MEESTTIVTTVSAYDLLPDDDREALAWVREMGGVEAAKARMMSEGCEWPKYTDGDLVRIGGCWGEDGCDTSITYIERIIFAEDGVYLDNEYNEAFYRHGERVKRPAPKVLDADGVEVEIGDDLYSVEGMLKFHVSHVDRANGKIATDAMFAIDKWADPKMYTHRAPVFAADGKPLCEGETVWHVGDGVEFTVIGLPRPGEYQAVKLRLDDGAVTGLDPDQLTHKRPVLDADGVEIRVGDVLYRKSDGHMVEVAEVYEKTFIDADDYVRPGDGFTHRAPVFAADVRPLHEGEHVYHVETGAELVVKELPKPGEYQAVVVFAPPASHLTSFDPNLLTHERPVLDADGVPLREGETVWDTKGNGPYIIDAIGGDGVVRIKSNDLDYFGADFTHERPDSIDRLAEDIDAMVEAWRSNQDLFEAQEAAAGCVGENTLGAALDSLVRRCRALAERGE